MSTNVEHIIPIQGLGIGLHEFDFKLDQKFFAQFDDSLVNGDFDVHLVVDKQSTLLYMDLTFEGRNKTECDRCLMPINLPVKGEAMLVVKYDEKERIEGDVIFIHPGSPVFDVTNFMHEAISVALPIVSRCEDTEACDDRIADYLSTEEEEESNPENDIWSVLNKLKPE